MAMTSLALPRVTVLRRAAARGLSAAFSERGSDVVLAVSLMAIAAVLLLNLPGSFSVDSWLALVTGRDLWHSGLPHHETLTVMAQGGAWIDQQWLAQLASYGLYLLGGLGLFGAANVALITISAAAAVLGARRLGARPTAVMLV